MLRRLPLRSVCLSRPPPSLLHAFSTTTPPPTVVTIGDITRPITLSPSSPSFVPSTYLQPLLSLDSPTVLAHLRWMLSKDNLSQDMFLLGAPSPYKRQLALAYAEMTNRDYHIISLSADTTESDLKQRREISPDKTSLLLNQAPVRAALDGSILILDGIQYAERNVLPLLNNLLENREMNLEDGRLLVSPARFESLIASDPSLADTLTPTHPDFRIIALGHPTPPYAGNSLDPPLRSRFQCRRVDPLSPHQLLKEHAPESGLGSTLPSTLSSLTAALETISDSSIDSSSLSLPVFPSSLLPSLLKTHTTFPQTPIPALLQTLYPFTTLPESSLTEAQKQASVSFTRACDRLNLTDKLTPNPSTYKLTGTATSAQVGGEATVGLTFEPELAGSPELAVRVPSGPNAPSLPPLSSYSSAHLTSLLQSHFAGTDSLLLAPPGSAKSHLASLFATTLGYNANLFSLYKDMSTRDLLAVRGTTPEGETTYNYSPLIRAAIDGDLCILDGVDKLSPHSLQILQQLLVDREITLPDSTRLLRADRHALLSATDSTLAIHPSFRVVALASLPTTGKQSKLLEDDLLAMFNTHYVPPPTPSQIEEILTAEFPTLPPTSLTRIMLFHAALDAATASSLSVSTLSLRNLIRVANKTSSANGATGSLHDAIRSVLMADLLPRTQQDILDELLAECAIDPPKVTAAAAASSEKEKFHAFKTPPNPARDATLIPSPLFFDIPQHITTINSIIDDMNRGENAILLIGNQGVGKNKIADRVLELGEIEREYIQLHRDSTVGQLTLSPSLVDGKITWEDSPLVRAVTHGRCLMIDEADKAPLEVVAVLKSLVEDGEMRLADGRIIGRDIPIHPDFRMFVLANRPGFPFLGNDFFREIGDCFASHAIPNPDLASEKSLLVSYAPEVSPAVIHKLATAFSHLRKLSDAGDITYPYSTREAVAAVKHISKYPQDGMVDALMNVLHFDTYDENLYSQLSTVFNSAGIPLPRSRSALRSNKVDTSKIRIEVAIPSALPAPIAFPPPTSSSPPTTRSSEFFFLEQRKWDMVTPTPAPFAPEEHRIESFTHLVRSWGVLPSNTYYSAAKDMVTLNDSVHVLTTSPITLHNFYDTDSNPTKQTIDFDSELPYYLPTNPPPVLAPLPKQNKLLAFFPSANMFLTMNPKTGKGVYVKLPDPNGTLGSSVKQMLGFKSNEKKQSSNDWKACDGWSASNRVLLHQDDGTDVCLLEFDQSGGAGCRWVDLSGSSGIDRLECAGPNELFAYMKCGGVKQVTLSDELSSGGPVSYTITDLDTDSRYHVAGSTPPPHLFEFPNSRALFSDEIEYATRAEDGDLFVTERTDPASKVFSSVRHPDSEYFAALREDNIIEVIDSVKHEKRVINAVGLATGDKKKGEFDFSEEDGVVATNMLMKPMGKDHVATLTNKGEVHVYEISEGRIAAELESFREMLGLPKHAVPDGEGMKSLTLNYESIRDGSEGESWKPPALDKPKFGQWDDKNEEHVGGSNWAGGTGGSNTAGLGGRGGPYRLDRGHKIHQVSDEAKAEVSEEATKVAREMAEKGLEDKLREIDMSEGEFAMYEGLATPIKSDIANLRNTLANAESKKAERMWLKKQTHGELDDSKLVDGVVGEKHVFKRRGVPPEGEGVIKTPKRIRFVFDCSGSMYRFNGQDGRLDRSLEAATLVMESFHGYGEQFDYSIVGHSGDSPCIELSAFGKPPKNEKERVALLKKMVAHTQFCRSGDHTLEGIARAKMDVVGDGVEADEYLVIAISDANLRRYGMNGGMLSRVLDDKMGLEQDVSCKVIMIASLGDEASDIKESCGSGKAFVAQSTSDLPRIMREILSRLQE